LNVRTLRPTRRNPGCLPPPHRQVELALAGTTLQRGAHHSCVCEEFPFHSWNGFLKMKAESGNEVALAVLQSLKRHVDEKKVTPPKPKPGVTHQVDNQGNVLYLLSDGGMIKDCGQDIHYSANCPAARAMAEDLAWRKFGPKFGFLGNTIKQTEKARSKQEESIQSKVSAGAFRIIREAARD